MIAGTITSSGVLHHPFMVAHLFGLGCLVRCLRAILNGRDTTFLALTLKPTRT